jgi:oligopeptide transport system ATP-binding protein
MRELRSEIQIIFQDPFASLNPRKRIGQILSKPFKIHTKMGKYEIEKSVLSLIESVGLTPAASYINRHPHEFSGGQRQRIGIARAMALQPKFIIADEPISSLDLSIRANIINLMKKFQKEMEISYLFITHDLSIVRSICDRVAVMYLGKIVELAEVNELFNNPFHPYTKALLSATPVPDPVLSRSRKKEIIEGEVASPIDPPSGCRFHPRCPFNTPTCSSVEPELVDVKDSHFVACHLSAV